MYVKKLWQTECKRYPENRLYKIQPKVYDPMPSHGRCSREETALCQLHIGHTFLTHFYFLKGEEPPICIPYDKITYYRTYFLQIARICRSAGIVVVLFCLTLVRLS